MSTLGKRKRESARSRMNPFDIKIEKTSLLDMNSIMKIVVETTIREGPEFRDSLFNSLKLLLYRILGPIYVWAKYESFKVAVSGKTVGSIVVKHVNTSSTHILAIGVHPSSEAEA